MVGWINQKSTSAIFYDLRSKGRKIIKFVDCDQGVLAHATAVYLQRPVGSHNRFPVATGAHVSCSAPSLPENPLHLPTGRLRDTQDGLMIGRLGHCAFHR